MPLLKLAGPRPSNLGVHDGRLAECPRAPKCVSSQATTRRHAIAPLPLRGTVQASMQRLVDLLLEWPEAELITEQPGYLHAEFTTALLGFVDDVEFLPTPDEGVVHVRSCSRLGYSDLGTNRSRIESIRDAYLNTD
ncbi:DUF1499 domain-containing protein [uncultured Abyssibacter sp.]|uniref:DUF1499 domain-containing protein n=1 Tax=uncultured Abyssibacter sp. TaxID=2320202 RepID=UPI0032B11315|tara:strand:- start:238 stop:645 length:408 start_codon:yes stop_codon:yes gene_type:complete